CEAILDLLEPGVCRGGLLFRTDLLCTQCPDLGSEGPVVTFGLVDLLRGGGLRGEESPGALVASPGDLVLHFQGAESLDRLETPRVRRASLRPRLLPFERQLNRIDPRHGRAGLQHDPFDGHKFPDLPRGLRRDDNLDRFEISVGIRGLLRPAARYPDTEEGE